MTYLLVTPTRCEPVTLAEGVALLEREVVYAELVDERGVVVLVANKQERKCVPSEP